MATTTATETTPTSTILNEKAINDTPKSLNKTTKFSWEDGPMSLIPTPTATTGCKDQYTHVATEMALVHNTIIRALNSIYIQAPHIPASEHANFTAYSTATHAGLTAHHDGEEEEFFPELERLTGETGLMDENVQGHRDFDTKFNAWGDWLKSIEAKQETFDATVCRAMMDDFMAPLQAHLAAEIPTLLALERYPDLDLLGLMKKEGEKVMGSMSKTALLPLFLLNHDTTFEAGIHSFPPVPAPVGWVLREVFGRWHAQWWKFSTVGYDGLPRELRFLGERK